MYKSVRMSLRRLAVCMLIALGTAGLAGLLTRGSMDIYKTIEQPPLAPPSIVFPIVWTILFILMGVSSYFISGAESEYKTKALFIYGIQLLLNFSWNPIFFNARNYLAAFIVLILLWIAVVLMIYYFGKINKLAAYLQIPYLLWITFAGYLNFMIYRLN